MRLLPLAASPFTLCLLTALRQDPAPAQGAGPAVADPFLHAAWEPAGTRAYLAELRSDTGVDLGHLVLKLPAAESAGALFPGEEAPANPAVEARWDAERRDLERLLPAAAYCAELVLPAAGGAAPMRLPPTLYCEVPGRFFRIPCPRCLSPLLTCRDDALLAASGMPLFSASAVCLLHCPDCLGQGREPSFYTAEEVPPAGLAAAGVAGLRELRARLAATLEERRGDAPAAEALPCLTCPEAAGCLASGPPTAAARKGRPGAAAGASRWSVFIPADAPYLVTRVPPIPVDAFFDLLGGREAREGEPAGTLFAAEGSGIDAVEVLTLKLAAFVQLTRALRQYSLLLDLPHLDLHPGQVAVEPGLRTGTLADMWSFRVKLTGMSSARMHPIVPAAAGRAGVEVLLPPARPSVPFASPAVQAACLATPSTAEALIERAAAEPGEGGLWRIEGRLRDPLGFFPPPSPRDWLGLDWPAGFAAGGTATAARLDPRGGGRGAGSELAFTSEPFAFSPAAAQHVARSGGLRVPGVRYRIYPALGVAEDLYSLGLFLLRALLVNDGQGLSDLTPVIAAVAQRDQGDRQGVRRTVDEVLSSLLADLPERLGKINVFHREVDRQADRPNSIPYEIWVEVLSLALRLTAGGPGFGLDAGEPAGAAAPGGDGTQLVNPLDAVLAQAEDLVRRLRGLLFERQPVHVEIQSVIAELLAEQESPGEVVRGPGTDPIKP